MGTDGRLSRGMLVNHLALLEQSNLDPFVVSEIKAHIDALTAEVKTQKIQLSQYAYETERAKRDRDKAEGAAIGNETRPARNMNSAHYATTPQTIPIEDCATDAIPPAFAIAAECTQCLIFTADVRSVAIRLRIQSSACAKWRLLIMW